MLVDRDPLAVDAIRRNLRVDAVRRTGPGCSAGTVGAFLGAGPPAEAPFDLVFFDPPYDQRADEVARVLSALIEGSWLTGGASAVVERGVGRVERGASTSR